MAQGDFQFGRLVLQRLGLGGDRKPPVAQLKRWLESRQRRRDPDEAHRLARDVGDVVGTELAARDASNIVNRLKPWQTCTDNGHNYPVLECVWSS